MSRAAEWLHPAAKHNVLAEHKHQFSSWIISHQRVTHTYYILYYYYIYIHVSKRSRGKTRERNLHVKNERITGIHFTPPVNVGLVAMVTGRVPSTLIHHRPRQPQMNSASPSIHPSRAETQPGDGSLLPHWVNNHCAARTIVVVPVCLQRPSWFKRCGKRCHLMWVPSNCLCSFCNKPATTW